VCAGFTCIFCSEKTLRQIPNDPTHELGIKIFRTAYLVLGWKLPVIGAYWLVKTVELKSGDLERKALLGHLPMNPQTLMH